MTIVTKIDDLRRAVEPVLRSLISELLPDLVRKATRKPYMTGQELADMTGWSRRTIQNLRDTRQIPFVQHGRKILYPTDGIDQFLRDRHISVRNSSKTINGPERRSDHE